jgi:hypothetical protein
MVPGYLLENHATGATTMWRPGVGWVPAPGLAAPPPPSASKSSIGTPAGTGTLGAGYVGDTELKGEGSPPSSTAVKKKSPRVTVVAACSPSADAPMVESGTGSSLLPASATGPGGAGGAGGPPPTWWAHMFTAHPAVLPPGLVAASPTLHARPPWSVHGGPRGAHAAVGATSGVVAAPTMSHRGPGATRYFPPSTPAGAGTGRAVDGTPSADAVAVAGAGADAEMEAGPVEAPAVDGVGAVGTHTPAPGVRFLYGKSYALCVLLLSGFLL